MKEKVKARLYMFRATKKSHECSICGRKISKGQKYFRIFDFNTKKDVKSHYKCLMYLRETPEWAIGDNVYDMVATYDQLEAFSAFLQDIPSIIKIFHLLSKSSKNTLK